MSSAHAISRHGALFLLIAGLLVCVDTSLLAQTAPPPARGLLVLAEAEDYRTPAGRMDDGVLRVALHAREVSWHPWGPAGPSVVAHAFAADDEDPRVPGPLIRVPAGTPVEVTVRNGLGHPLLVRGLHDRGELPAAPAPFPAVAAFAGDSVLVEPGAEEVVRFTPRTPGTYVYYGRTLDPRDRIPAIIPGGDAGDGPFIGVLIVDSPETAPDPDERIFLITNWVDQDVPDSWDPTFKFMINGLSWPHSERLVYGEGDTVRWRVINASGTDHPMHLHGFFFRVDARGDQVRETVYPHEERWLAVTENLAMNETMRLTWVAEEPGNWVFHCHLMRHMTGVQGPITGSVRTGHHGPQPGAAHPDEVMAGLVLGIEVRPDPALARDPEVPRRRLRLHALTRPGVFGEEAAYSFVLQEGEREPAADSLRIPGTPIVLTRGEPVEIAVVNRTDIRLGVHWHGLELESWADGVPGWSGYGVDVRPAIAPGDTFVVRMTPPRAGTFMYHVHSEPGHELAQGLYGPFLVLEPGERWDPETDRLFVLGGLGARQHPPPAVNGELEPGPIEVAAGTTYRLRFMHISPDETKRVRILTGGESVRWSMAAKDGADVPAARRAEAPADLLIAVGETYDFLWTPERPGELTLRIDTGFDGGPPPYRRPAPPPHTVEIPVRVR